MKSKKIYYPYLDSSNSSTPLFHWKFYPLQFRNTIYTSRGSMQEKKTYFLVRENPIPNQNRHGKNFFIGEAGYIPGLTLDDWESYAQGIPESILQAEKNKIPPDLNHPSLRFAWEMLFPDIYARNCPEDFLTGKIGLPINGLVWMGDRDHQKKQITDLLDRNFTTLKLKIGGLNFHEELSLIEFLFQEAEKRKKKIIVRLDANGSFSLDKALEHLYQLSQYPVHSLEQPLPPLYLIEKRYQDNYRKKYHRIIKESPIPIALDEEIIGVITLKDKQQLLDDLLPHYLVLKPGIHGGFSSCEEWIRLAQERKIGWWVTSALESNLGLTAISLWTAAQTAHHHLNLTQGLGTGGLYTNNFLSPLTIKEDRLFYDSKRKETMRESLLKKLKIQ